MTFRERINEGLEGKYKGLSNGFNRVNNYIFGVQRACYTLLGGMSGASKTKITDFIIINAIQDAEAQNIPINIWYYSYEINEESKRADWLSILIHKKYNRIITPEKIKGLGDLRLTKEELMIVESEIPELEKLFSKIKWIWEATNPTGMYVEWFNFMKERGTFDKESYIDESGETKERIVKFTPNNPEEYNIAVVDHIALTRLERGFELKQNLDKLSEYAVKCRNLFKMSFFFIQQFNDGLSSIERQKFKGVDISPQQTDFRDSRNPYIDADVVLGLMNAYKMDMENCLGYNINETFDSAYNLKDRFRMLKIIKNRLGRDNIAIGLLFIAESCYFEELKKPNEMNFDDFSRINELMERK